MENIGTQEYVGCNKNGKTISIEAWFLLEAHIQLSCF